MLLLTLSVQNLANLVEFGGKEPYMEVVNPFILKNKERMVVFLDHLSSVREKPYPDEVLLTSSIAQSACLAVKQSAYERPTPSSHYCVCRTE